jgi:hypothetical protein
MKKSKTLKPSLKNTLGWSAMILITTSAVKIIVKTMLRFESIYKMVSLNDGYLSKLRQIVFSTITSIMQPSNRGCEISVNSCIGSLFL